MPNMLNDLMAFAVIIFALIGAVTVVFLVCRSIAKRSKPKRKPMYFETLEKKWR